MFREARPRRRRDLDPSVDLLEGRTLLNAAMPHGAPVAFAVTVQFEFGAASHLQPRMHRAPLRVAFHAVHEAVRAVIALALGGLGGPSEELLFAHMIEHLLLGDIGALLIVLGLTGPVIAPVLRAFDPATAAAA